MSVVASIGVMGGLLTTAMTASAGDGVAGTVRTAGAVLNVRTGPATTYARKATIPNRHKLTVVCQKTGQLVRGDVRTTAQWDRLPTGWYVSDAFVVRPAGIPVPPCDQSRGRVTPPLTSPPPTPAAPVFPGAPAASAAGWVAPIPGVVGSGFRSASRPGHDGIDMSAPKNTPIYAAGAGTVVTVVCNVSTGNCNVDGSLSTPGCGWYVEILHSNKVVTRYCHMIRRPSVKEGQAVKAGQVIGYVGSSGHSSGPHLHFEVHTNAPPARAANAVEPIAFLKARGVVLK
ncbi:MAG TPA: peptidoglycan DD-metalloendopeptidase family protein [Pilimelia sp.]|nr:peptidoglycan DD-metalloendopeptidase family protein [Pilimelia sp.]